MHMIRTTNFLSRVPYYVPRSPVFNGSRQVMCKACDTFHQAANWRHAY